MNQEKKEKCKEYLNSKIKRIFISDFSLHSIGVILFRLEKNLAFDSFLNDLLPRIELIGLPLKDYYTINLLSSNFKLDFDDAYQAAVAKSFGLTISTMDKDFKRLVKVQKIEFLK